MRGGKPKSFGMLVLFLITGAVLGGILGELIAGSSALAGLAPYLTKYYTILDVPPVALNLYVVKFVIGFALHPNLISILGIVVALILFRFF